MLLKSIVFSTFELLRLISSTILDLILVASSTGNERVSSYIQICFNLNLNKENFVSIFDMVPVICRIGALHLIVSN